MAGEDKPIVIGVLGKDSFGNSFEPIMDKKLKGKDVIAKRFKGFKELKESADKSELDREIKAIVECHCSSKNSLK